MWRFSCVLFCFVFLLIKVTYAQSFKSYGEVNTQINGKINNIDLDDLTLVIAINRIGFEQKIIELNADSAGNFSTDLFLEKSTDAWVVNKTNFLIILNPGDSLFIEFDGNTDNRAKLLEKIKFTGKGAEINQQISGFQSLFYKERGENYFEQRDANFKNKTPKEYLIYLEKLKLKKAKQFKNFKATFNPSDKAKIWIQSFLDQEIFFHLWLYPIKHRTFNKINFDSLKLPLNYYDGFKNYETLNPSMLFCSRNLDRIADHFYYAYIFPQTSNEIKSIASSKHITYQKVPQSIKDSIELNTILRYTDKDTILRQIILTQQFRDAFKRVGTSNFENHIDFATKHITLPFLIYPLLEEYQQIKNEVKNKNINFDSILLQNKNREVTQLFDSIYKRHKGKFIYIDNWATWCGPCISQFKEGKMLKKDLKDENVAFIYICIDSKEDAWKETIAKHDVEGEHYFLNETQSQELKKMFELKGVPFYILISQEGKIIKKGFDVRPENAKVLINKLLK